MEYQRLIPVIRRLAIEAGEKIMEIYDSPDFEVRSKSDDSPVTAADEAADALISAGLAEAFPEVLIVTEEQAVLHTGRWHGGRRNRSLRCPGRRLHRADPRG